MRFRRQYTLYSDKAVKGKPIWYFRVYLPDGKRRAKMLNPIESEGMNPIKPDKKAKWASGMRSLNAVNILFDSTK